MTKPDDIVDAEFEIVEGDGTHAAAPRHKSRDVPPVAPVSGVTNQDADRVHLGAFGDAAQPKKSESMSVTMFATVACLCSFTAFGVGAAYAYFSAPIGPSLPVPSQQAAVAIPDQDVFGGLLLHDLSFEQGVTNGREYMSVEGVVRNEGEQPVIIPPLRLVFGPEGEPQARYRIDRGETLKPGEQIVFTTRIPLRDTDPVGPKLEFIR